MNKQIINQPTITERNIKKQSITFKVLGSTPSNNEVPCIDLNCQNPSTDISNVIVFPTFGTLAMTPTNNTIKARLNGDHRPESFYIRSDTRTGRFMDVYGCKKHTEELQAYLNRPLDH